MSDLSQEQVTITKEEYETLAALRYSLRRFLRFSEAAAEAIGLTPQQHQALLAIKGYPGRERITVGELGERLQIRHHSAVGLVNRLDALGLVIREQDTEDRRVVYISLSDRGSNVLEQLAAAHKQELRHSGRELAQLLETISRE